MGRKSFFQVRNDGWPAQADLAGNRAMRQAFVVQCINLGKLGSVGLSVGSGGSVHPTVSAVILLAATRLGSILLDVGAPTFLALKFGHRALPCQFRPEQRPASSIPSAVPF